MYMGDVGIFVKVKTDISDSTVFFPCYRWHTNHKFNQYAKIREKIMEGLLLAVPSFGAVMLQISKLLNELITVRMLPLELE